MSQKGSSYVSSSLPERGEKGTNSQFTAEHKISRDGMYVIGVGCDGMADGTLPVLRIEEADRLRRNNRLPYMHYIYKFI